MFTYVILGAIAGAMVVNALVGLAYLICFLIDRTKYG